MSEGALLGMQLGQQLVGGFADNGQQVAGARALDENARLTQTQGAYDALDALRRGRAQEGVDITTAAAHGGLGGSIGDLLQANAVQRELEAANIRYSAASKAYGLRTEAAQARANGRAAIIGGVFRAGAAAIQGVSSQRSAARLRTAEFGGASGSGGATAQPLGTIPVPFDFNKGWKFDPVTYGN